MGWFNVKIFFTVNMRRKGVFLKYKCENELEHISFRDASIVDIEIIPNINNSLFDLVFHISGAIIKDNNSCNEYYTDKYADVLNLRFKGAEIEALLLEGHKLYDANDILVEDIPDEPIAFDNYKSVIKSFNGCEIFYGGSPEKENPTDAGRLCYQFIIDKEDDSYVISLLYDKAIAEWDKFLNKVYQT